MRIALIVARAENGIIGRAGGLPWRLPGDMRFFKEATMGKPVVMGRKTFEPIGSPLKGRANIVVTSHPAFPAAGVQVTHELETALDLARRIAAADGAAEVMVIGGAQIYRQALPHADRVYLTEVHAEPEGDARFPALDPTAWREVSRTPHGADGPASPAYDIVVLDRV